MAQFYTIGGAVPIRIDRAGGYHWTKAKTGAQVMRGKRIYNGELLFYKNKFKGRSSPPHPVLVPALKSVCNKSSIDKRAFSVAFKAAFK